MEIRRLKSAGAGLLQRIAPEVFDGPVLPQQLDRFLGDPRHLMFVAVEKETVVGMASAFEYFHPDKPPQLFINEVGVAATHRRRGIGRSLVRALIAAGRKRGCAYAWLGTATDNAAGRACFDSVPGHAEPQPFLLYEWAAED